MIFPLKLVVNNNTKKFDMAYLLYWMVINDNRFLQAWKVLGVKSVFHNNWAFPVESYD